MVGACGTLTWMDSSGSTWSSETWFQCHHAPRPDPEPVDNPAPLWDTLCPFIEPRSVARPAEPRDIRPKMRALRPRPSPRQPPKPPRTTALTSGH